MFGGGSWLLHAGMLDVQQIFGRAGRPQFEDEGLGIIITQHAQLAHYLGMLTHQTPIESKFTDPLVDNLNAEIVLGKPSVSKPPLPQTTPLPPHPPRAAKHARVTDQPAALVNPGSRKFCYHSSAAELALALSSFDRIQGGGHPGALVQANAQGK